MALSDDLLTSKQLFLLGAKEARIIIIHGFANEIQ